MAQHSDKRIPISSTLKIGVKPFRYLQVNFCKNPNCENFGIPAKEEFGKPGPSPDRDMRYKVTNTAKGRTPALLCKVCKEKIPIKSNQGIAAEFERISQAILTLPEKTACHNDGCVNNGLSVGGNPHLYRKAGFSPGTQDQLYQCKGCLKRILVSDPVRIYKKTRHLASDLFSRVVNKSPVRGTVRGMSIKSPDSYYAILDFVSRCCDRLSGTFDRRMIEGQIKLPSEMQVSVDVQEYLLNWSDKKDRRNTKFSTLCSVDQSTRFILGICANYDKDADSFDINREAALNGDILRPEAFRQKAQYWLTCDEYLGGRALGEKLGFDKSQDVLQQISNIYATAQSRDDIENREDEVMDVAFCNPILTKGMQTHIPYTCYAHFLQMQMLFKGAGVEKIFYYMDCDSMLRAGFISAFEQEIKERLAHGFYVRYTKFLTTPKKTDLYEKAKEAVKDYKTKIGSAKKREAEILLMQERISKASHIGKWKDKWVTHPLPSMNEPNKAVCWLTEPESGTLPDQEIAQMYLDVGINAVDNIFQISRRLMNAFERPIGTSSGYNTVWHGYSPYNPKMVEKYLSLLRAYNNFIKVGDDKKTPAMRLGLTKRPLTYDDVLWPGENIPRAPRKKRKGIKLPDAYDDISSKRQ